MYVINVNFSFPSRLKEISVASRTDFPKELPMHKRLSNSALTECRNYSVRRVVFYGEWSSRSNDVGETVASGEVHSVAKFECFRIGFSHANATMEVNIGNDNANRCRLATPILDTTREVEGTLWLIALCEDIINEFKVP